MRFCRDSPVLLCPDDDYLVQVRLYPTARTHSLERNSCMSWGEEVGAEYEGEVRSHKRGSLVKKSVIQKKGIKIGFVECVTAVLQGKRTLEKGWHANSLDLDAMAFM